MTIITRNTQASQNTYALIRKSDQFGTGYLVQHTCFLQSAVRDGWEVLMSNLTYEEAHRAHSIYSAPLPAIEQGIENPSLDTLLTYDMTEAPKDRQGQPIEEFDLVNIVIDGFWLEGTVTAIEEDYIEIDGNWIVDRDGIQCELIAKADDDCGFIVEYGEYLDQLSENYDRLYEAAISATSALSAA